MNALQAGTEVADTVREFAKATAQRLLVVALEEVDLSAFGRVARDPVLYRLPKNAASGHDPWLPFHDDAFDTVVLYRLTSHNVDMQLLLGESARVLHRTGRVLVLGHQADFSFAPLPDAGPAHLMQGWLREAGFRNVDFLARSGPQVIAVAEPYNLT